MRCAIGLAFLLGARLSAPAQTLPGTAPLTESGPLAAQMVAGIDRYLLRAAEEAKGGREARWRPDWSSAAAFEASVTPNRERLRRLIGAVDARVPFDAPALDAAVGRSAVVATAAGYRVLAVRWPVLEGVDAEGLLLEPTASSGGSAALRARVVALPDADQPPEAVAAGVGKRLAENGCLVLIPTLIDSRDTWSGTPRFGYTNQTHREFLYRMAYEMGRHPIGYEAQKTLAAVDWFARAEPRLPIGVHGYGEGGLIALYAAALDRRIDAVAVSGYFGPREELWREPIYRNVWSLLAEFGDAGVARLIAPRRLIVEAAPGPEIEGPPAPSKTHRATAAPGRLTTPPLDAVRAEFARARSAWERLGAADRVRLVERPGDATLSTLLAGLGGAAALRPAGAPARSARTVDADARMRRQLQQLIDFTQRLVAESPFVRAKFWERAETNSLDSWKRSKERYRSYLWDEVIGRLPAATEPLAVRTRVAYTRPAWTGYEVWMPVWRDVFAYGVLLLPKDLKPGERRPVVVCQHGLEGTPQSTIDTGPARRPWAAELAERGFVVYLPQNPYIGEEKFRTLQRKANPLKLSLFSFILGQHKRTLEWLAAQPFVDPARIGFYGISYGGKTAMRVPSLLDEYALSICSADFNEWIWKNTRTDFAASYLYTKEYEMPEFDLGETFNYSELAMLIAPRPFMVERGHKDGVSIDEWVAYEYARVRRFYVQLGLADRTTIEFFNGPHTIHGEGTYEFLHRHLNWPAPRPRP
jgi:dienelactone hydrolase